jgi:hypothetical protein
MRFESSAAALFRAVVRAAPAFFAVTASEERAAFAVHDPVGGVLQVVQLRGIRPNRR